MIGTLCSVEGKLAHQRGSDTRAICNAQEKRQKRDDEILKRLETEDNSAVRDDKLFSAIMFLILFECTYRVLIILRIGFQNHNNEMLGVLEVPELADKETEDFVTEHLDLAKLCLNIG